MSISTSKISKDAVKVR